MTPVGRIRYLNREPLEVMMLETFLQRLTTGQRSVYESLDSPAAIQAFLDGATYSSDDANRCPIRVIDERQAHCLDGALFAAAALRRIGFPPLILDMLPEPGTDDDHLLAIYRLEGRYGAVAKSNFTGLRAREPVYRTLRELVLSYFEFFFNVDGLKTLRSFTRPYNLALLDRYGWMWSDEGADEVERRLDGLNKIPLIGEETARRLSPVDPLTYRAGMLVVNQAGLYRPGKTGTEDGE